MDLALPSAVVDDGREISAEQLGVDVARVAAGLDQRGVRTGDRVIVSLANSYEFVVVHLAIDLLGAVTVNLPTGFRREVGQVARMVDASLCVMHEVETPGLYGDLRSYVTLEQGLEPLLADPASVPSRERRPADRTWLAFTSGSTGTPRAAVHTRRSLEASTRAMAQRYGLGTDDVLFVAAPVGHAIGFCYGVRLAIACGCRLVLQRSWDPDLAASLIDSQRCTFAAIPTPFLADLLDAETRPRQGTLQRLLVGGAPVARDQVLRAERIFGRGVTSGYYGSSECGAVLSSPPDAPDEERLSTDGLPMPGVQVRIVDEDGADVAPGQEGEMLVRGEQVALGYWANNDSDGQFRSDGWFATRDRVVMDDSGYVAAMSRMKDVIFRGAVNVIPREVEEAVASHPDVGRVVVFGRPHHRLGEQIVAAITVTGSAPDRDEVRRWLGDAGLARSKWPDVVAVVEQFPRTPTGKIDRARVREELLRKDPAP